MLLAKRTFMGAHPFLGFMIVETRGFLTCTLKLAEEEQPKLFVTLTVLLYKPKSVKPCIILLLLLVTCGLPSAKSYKNVALGVDVVQVNPMVSNLHI